MPYHTKYLDCYFNREPKTDLSCCCCNKDIKPDSKYRMVHWIGGGPFILHPSEEKRYQEDMKTNDQLRREDLGIFIIGMSCARKLGMEWTLDPR